MTVNYLFLASNRTPYYDYEAYPDITLTRVTRISGKWVMMGMSNEAPQLQSGDTYIGIWNNTTGESVGESIQMDMYEHLQKCNNTEDGYGTSSIAVQHYAGLHPRIVNPAGVNETARQIPPGKLPTILDVTIYNDDGGVTITAVEAPDNLNDALIDATLDLAGEQASFSTKETPDGNVVISATLANQTFDDGTPMEVMQGATSKGKITTNLGTQRVYLWA